MFKTIIYILIDCFVFYAVSAIFQPCNGAIFYIRFNTNISFWVFFKTILTLSIIKMNYSSEGTIETFTIKNENLCQRIWVASGLVFVGY